MKAKKQESVVDILKKDHREVEALFSRIGKANSPSKKKQLFDTLNDELTKHAEAEEAILYPRMQEITELRQHAFEAFEEHGLAKYLLQDLAAIDTDSEEWDAKCIVLKELIGHHVEEEEGEIFPQLKKQVEKDELLMLGQHVKEFKEQHPGADKDSLRRRQTPDEMTQQPNY